VRGNVDWNNWTDIFQGLDIHLFKETETLDLGPVLLTGLSWTDSWDPSLQVPGGDLYHIILGHYPDFSLGESEADLLVAGHTHGGQFQLPVVGPLLTNSRVPKSWASGFTEIKANQYLLVSNGIGMERGYAPRMRFLCRPELIILHLHPAP
jgi:predicted MPP superfamily phosphohydrolase